MANHHADGASRSDNMSILNPSPSLIPGSSLLHELISGPQVDGIALDYLDQDGSQIRLCYQDLHSQSDALAQRLLPSLYSSRSGRPNIVPVFISQCPSYYVSILAILKAGAAFCPLNLDVPAERLKFILDDVSAKVVLTVSELETKLVSMQDLPVIVVDGTRESASQPGKSSPPKVDPKDLAYIMYTSGSTGLPKAVCISHQAVTQSLLAHDTHIPAFTRFLQFASPTFDVSVFEIFFPWIRGSTLVACNRAHLLKDLPSVMTNLDIDAAELTPSVAASLVRGRENVPTLKLLLTIGEMLNPQVVREFGGSASRPSILYGMYGPTEAAIHCTLQPAFMSDMAVNTIGIPLNTVSCFIVKPTIPDNPSADLEILPIGEIGELAVGGHQLADGYLNRDEQTRSVFVTHPQYGPLYRTGDKARLLQSGRLECLGRISSGQVKLRGQRIELGEIEHAASQTAGCHAVIASIISGVLVAFCIADAAQVSVRDIRTACQEWLPQFMVPNDIVLLPDFPYLPSGKIDKRQLESDYIQNLESAEQSSPAESPEVTRLLQVFQSVLGVNLRANSDLGSSGLDSLRAIQLSSELRKNGYPHIGAADLLAFANVPELVNDLGRFRSSEDSQEAVTSQQQEITKEIRRTAMADSVLATSKDKVDEVYPCTPVQDAMLSETAQDPKAYCNTVRISLPSTSTLSSIRAMFRQLALQHQALRSGFFLHPNRFSAYCQVVWDNLDDAQTSQVDDWDNSFTVKSSDNLSHPFHVQFKQSTKSTEALLLIHHALYDQWSLDVLLEDLDLLLQGQPIPTRPPFRHVAEFYMREQIAGDARSPSLDFWQESLSGASTTHLPKLLGKRVSHTGLETTTSGFEIDMEQLRDTAQRVGCSPHVFFQATFGFLLSLYTNTDDILFGTVFSGRTKPIEGIESVFGPILATLPSRVNVAECRRFKDLLTSLHGANREIMKHDTIPLSEIKRTCGFPAGQLLFDSIFVWQETSRTKQENSHAQILETRDFLEFALTLEIEPSAVGVSVKATYKPSVMPSEQVQLFLAQLASIAKHAASDPDCLLSNLHSVLEPSLLSITNPTPRWFDFTHGLGGFVEQHAANDPDAPAIHFAAQMDESSMDEIVVTYQELNERANQLAHHLLSIGTQPDDLVCVFMEKSIDLYVSILAVVKAGAAYLPLIPETPPQRLRKILEDSCARTCLCDNTTISLATNVGLEHVIDVTTLKLSSNSTQNPQVEFNQTNLAYAVFTSGTTGQPKGVLVTIENIMSNIRALERLYPVPTGSRLLQACNQAFDVSVFEIFFAWCAGMCLCSATKDVLFRDLENSIALLKITHLSMTPTVAALVNPDRVPTVRFLVTAGEAVTHHVHMSWAGRGLYQGYGPSETTNICTVKPSVLQHDLINNVGAPFDNTSGFVLSTANDFDPVPAGALGELCFGGQQVFRGYQNMPELTKSKIIEHPRYGRIYRSGDLGRLLANGDMLIEGRIDDQRKLRGQRIELGEIVNCILQSFSVHDCSVQILGSSQLQERLVAFWIPRNQQAREFSVVKPSKIIKDQLNLIHESIAGSLPAYMMPTTMVPITALPMTHQGKVDNKFLAQVFERSPEEDLQAYSPQSEDDQGPTTLTDTEDRLARELQKTLQIQSTSIHRNTSFFGLGLDSLSAIRFSRNIKEVFQQQVDVSEILKRPTLGRLAATLEERAANQPSGACKTKPSALDNFLPREVLSNVRNEFVDKNTSILSILPCTPLQEAMLSASSSHDASAYSNRMLFKLAGDADRVKYSWKAMIERHDILRTVFRPTDDARHPFVQVVLSEWSLPWAVSGSYSRDPLETLRDDPDMPALLDGFEPPYRLNSFHAGSKSYLLIDMHHALYDANAMSNLLGEIEQYYRGLELASAVHVAPFLNHLVSQDAAISDSFFEVLFRGFSPKRFPEDKLKQHFHQSDSSGFRTIHKDLGLVGASVNEFLQKHSLSLIALCHAAWAKTLSLLQSSSDLSFGNVVSGRSIPVDNIDALVAPCFNTLPLRTNLAKARNNLDLIRKLQQLNVDLLPHQLAPLRRIQQNVVSGRRIFESLVLLQQKSRPLNRSIWSLEGETGEMDFPCIIEIMPRDDTLDLSLHFERRLLGSETTMSAIADALLASFISCIKYPQSDVQDLVDFDKNSIAGLLKPDEDANTVTPALAHQGRRGEDWTSTEVEIRDAFAAISQTAADRIMKDTTIYRIGMDSISAIQAARRLRKRGLDISAADILENPTTSGLASVVQSRVQTPHETTPAVDLESFDQEYRAVITKPIGINETVLEAIRPCTSVQAGMISQFLHSDGAQYFNHIFFKLDPDQNVDEVRNAWMQVAHSHEMLRTGFTHTEDPQYPFAMLTYRTADLELSWLEPERHAQGSHGFVELERSCAQEVLSNLHLPAWRFRFCEVDGLRVMQLSMHHAIYDAETLQMIQADFDHALRGKALEHRGSIDSALAQILKASSDNGGDDESFWTKELQGITINRFPNLTPVVIKDREMMTLDLACELKRGEIEAHCQDLGISMQAAGQLAWARLLSAYTGDSLITFGVVLSGRAAAETAGAAFPCINTLPVFCNTESDDTSLLKQLMSWNALLQKRSFTPLTTVQRYAGLPNEAMFDTIFAYQKTTAENISDLAKSILHEEATVDYAISIELESRSGDRLGFRLTFDSGLVPKQQAHIILRQLEDYLMQIINATEMTPELRDLSVLPPKDALISSEAKLLHELVDISVKAYSDSIALEFVTDLQDGKVTSRCWTYAQLDIESNRVAHLLQLQGAQPGNVIAVSFDKCPEASFAFLGILKAGCAFLAVDASAPVVRKEFILQDSNARILLTTEIIASELSASKRLQIVDLPKALDRKDLETAIRKVEINPSMISYVLYTSGTTGTPKGCEITQENVVQLMLAFQRLFKGRWTNKSRWLQFASYHFDVAVVEQFWSWSVGIRVVSATRDLVLEDLPGFIDTLQITHLDLTPSLGRLLDPQLVPSLHYGVFITGGEAVKQDTIQRWGQYGCLFNFYGPTECTIGVTVFPELPSNGKASNIGWQFDNVGTMVLKPNSDVPVMRGAVGELCISGKLVGKGYLNRPELNQEKFPYLERYRERVYRTGDLARLLHDGSYEFLGRADNQIKLRGQRLEIDEIDAVIRACAGIEDTVCLVVKDSEKQKEQLISFVALSSNRKQGKPELCYAKDSGALIQSAKTACEERLPAYMVPTHIFPVKCLPLSVNNKLDGKLLTGLYQDMSTSQIQEYGSQSADQRPLSGIEQTICELLGETLGTPLANIRPDASVFALGLSSISAISFSRRLKARGYHNAHVTIIMKNDKISKLAKALSQSSSSEHGEVAVARQTITACRQKHMSTATQSLSCTPHDIEAIAPCTSLQQGIIYRSLDSETGLYFNTFNYKVKNVNIEALRKALELLVTETQILRTVFLETEDGHIQIVKRQSELLFLELDDGDALRKRKDKWIKSNKPNLRYPFEVLVSRQSPHTIMHVHIHHALYDGNSWALLTNRLVAAYNGDSDLSSGVSFIEALPFGPLRCVQGAKEFWLNHLGAATVGEMHPIEEHMNPKQRDTLYTATLQDLGGVEEIRKQLNVTSQALLQATWAATLSRYYRGPIGLVVSGRSMEMDNTENVVGPLFNTVPFFLRIRRDDSWQDLVQRCHEFNVGALPYQHTALRDIAKWCKKGPSEPLFEALFVFQQSEQQDDRANELFELQEEGDFTADYPIALEMEEDQDGSLKATLAAQGHLCNMAQARALILEFQDNLKSLIAGSQDNVGERLGANYEPVNGDKTNARSQPDMNGVHDFTWTKNAYVLRDEIAVLASADPSDIDEHTSVFGVGLDSIDAVKLSARLRKKGLNLAVSTIMRSQTIPRMVSHLAEKASGPATKESRLPQLEKQLTELVKRSKVDARRVERVVPASPMQEALYAEMVQSSYHGYFNHDVLRLGKQTDIARLEKAWQTVVHASPILRTAFAEVDDPSIDLTFAQVVFKPTKFSFTRIDIDNPYNPEEVMETVRHTMMAIQEPSPPFRLTLATSSKQKYLLISISHALYDGYSLGLLHEDVHRAYQDCFKPRPTYDIVLERAILAASEDAEHFWRDLLSDASRTTIPVDSLQANVSKTYRKERLSALSAQTVSAFCRQQGITAQALCQTVWSLVLSHYAKSLDVLYGVVLAGRDSPDAEQAMFPTMNTVAMRSIIHGSRQEMLRDSQSTIANVMQFQQTPLRKIQAAAKVKDPIKDDVSAASSSSTALFNTLFIYQKRPDDSNSDPSERLYESIGGAADVEYPVAVEAEFLKEDLVWRTACKSEALNSQQTTDLLENLDLVLKEIVEHVDLPTLSFVSEGISVCGLPAFKQQAETKTDSSPDSESGHGVDGDDNVWSDVEIEIRTVVAKLTKTPKDEISKHVRLQNLGVDSISAIKLSSLLRAKSLRISVSSIMQAGSIAAMAAKLQATDNAKAKSADSEMPDMLICKFMTKRGLQAHQVGFDPSDVEKVLPATAGQAYMLSIWQSTKGHLFYPEFQYTLKGSSSIETVKQAWEALVTRREILRTTFVATEDREVPYVQVVLRKPSASFADTSTETEQSEQGRQPFAHLTVQHVKNGYNLRLKIHHALYDAVSLPILIHDLEQLVTGKQPSLPQLSISEFLAMSITDKAISKRKDFWTTYLKGINGIARLSQPRSSAFRRIETFNPRALDLDAASYAKLRVHGLSLQSLFFAAYAKVYASLLSPGEKHPSDVVIGIYLANRSHIDDLSSLAAPTINLVPLRIRNPAATTNILEIAKQLQDDLQTISGPEISAAGLGEIEQWTGVRIDSFVNFIKLPDSVDEEGAGKVPGDKGEGVCIEEVDDGRSSEVRSMVHGMREESGFEVPEEMKKSSVGDVYLHSFDIEATVANGALAIGAFGWEDMVGLEQANKVVEDVARGLREAFET